MAGRVVRVWPTGALQAVRSPGSVHLGGCAMTSEIFVRPVAFWFLNDVVMAEMDRRLTVEELALDAQYAYMIQRDGLVGVAAHTWLHEPKRCGGQWWCMAPDCRELWVCKSVRRAWKAQRRIERGLPCPL
ncbi:hypothetical protein GCM10023321_19330 [Pseudonocardia eucalypti]|uniref:Uncharacterized protein n=1 Tax=Pseudonocardia eucalypti TaxID=648755 RepID=A0ABP9PUD7_9PSEU